MEKVNIIQFLPYYPPHKGGLETHAMEFSECWVRKGYGRIYNIITDIGQNLNIEKDKIIVDGVLLGYKVGLIENFIIPSIELIPNFPIYKFWSKEYKIVKKYLSIKNVNIVITRTRFFISSYFGGLFVRKNKIKWCHIEHGSDYVRLNSKLKNLIAYLYDRSMGKWIFKKSNILIGVSNVCMDFILNNFIKRKVEVIYRGYNFISEDLSKITEEDLKERFDGKILIGFVGRLYKWKNAENLINAFYQLKIENRDLKELINRIQIVIIGDGEDFERLKKMDKHNLIYFTGGKDFKNALKLQSQFDIYYHTSSPGGGLSGSLVQGMYFSKIVVATPNEGANEIIKDKKNGILLKDSSIEEIKRGLELGVLEFEKGTNYLSENKKIIKDNFDWYKNIEKYYNLFK